MENRQELGMKWYKFLIYFALWAGAILNFITAITYLTGSVYEAAGGSAELVYSAFPKLKGVDVFYGLILIVFSVFQIVVRYFLAGYKQKAPYMLLIMYVAVIVLELFYAIVGSIIIGESLFGEVIITIIAYGILTYVNYKYFENRIDLFIK